MELRLKQDTVSFYVECKWRKKLYKDGVEFATIDQLERYKNFEKKNNIPVFIAIGLGGVGAEPEQLFVVPLRDMRTNFINFKTLEKYEKKIDGNFFYDIEKKVLK